MSQDGVRLHSASSEFRQAKRQTESCCLHGRYEVSRSMLKPPLLDPTVPVAKLAAWIDVHTMHVHQFLDKLDQVQPAISVNQEAFRCLHENVCVQNPL